MSRQCSGCENSDDCAKLEDFQRLKEAFTGELGSRESHLNDSLSAENLVLYSCALGRHLANPKVNLRTAQIRKFLDAFRSKNGSLGRGVGNARDEAFLLEPRLAYAAGRQRREVGPLFEVLKPAIERVRDEKDFGKLTRFLESVVAYHRFHGGREG